MITVGIAALLFQSPFVPLRQVADHSQFNLGSAVDAWALQGNLDGGAYEANIVREVNMVEPENDLKPPAIWTGPVQYNFANSDFLLGAPGQTGWAGTNKLKVRGHVLVYARDDGYTIPGWLLASEISITPTQARTMLHDYITTLVGRYKGKIAIWDVINECIDDSPNGNPYNLRNSFWFRKLGPDFIVDAFKDAHAADPAAKLYINDYSIEGGGTKADELLNLVTYARSQGAPVNGIGLQYHIGLWASAQPGDGHYQMVQRIANLGLKFMVTELDVAIPVVNYPQTDPRFGLVASNPQDLVNQAALYGSVMKMCVSSKNCEGAQTWGFSDRLSWIPTFEYGMGAALPFDGAYQPKAAAWQIEKVLQTRFGTGRS